MLRPIDMTITIQNAAEAQRAGAQDSQAARPEVASQMFADRLEKQAKLQEQQVAKTNEAEKNEVQPDREGQGGGYNPRRKPAKKKSGLSEKSKARPVGESLYDIRI